MNIAQFLELFDFIETMGPYWSRVHACRYPLISESPPIRPTFKLWTGNVDTRSAEAKPLYKINKLVSIWGPLKPEMFHFGVLLCLTTWTGARMFEACTDQILEFRRQGGWKHMSKAQFLELSGFKETMGAYWSRVHACRYPPDFRISPNPSHFQVVDGQRQHHAQCWSKTFL